VLLVMCWIDFTGGDAAARQDEGGGGRRSSATDGNVPYGPEPSAVGLI
jgi:hypothetical protein